MGFGRTVLFSGGKMNLEFVSKYLKKQRFDKVVCVDAGLTGAALLGIHVDAVLGDFDSVPSEVLEKFKLHPMGVKNSTTFVSYPAAKDYTDTSMAVEWVLDMKPSEIVILGATGGRLDHLLANINILYEPLKKGVPAYLVDEFNRLYLINGAHSFYREDIFGKYISFLPLTTCVTGVTLKGFEYPLDNEILKIGMSRAISNEFADGSDVAEIMFDDGTLIVVEARDTWVADNS